ncbi:MAG: hypothetical protein R6U93_07220 [Dehalococcoidia bacterium]|jgi:hypothetical protein
MKALGQAYMAYREARKELEDKASEYWDITWVASGVPVVLPKNALTISGRKELFRFARKVERKLQMFMIELDRG